MVYQCNSKTITRCISAAILLTAAVLTYSCRTDTPTQKEGPMRFEDYPVYQGSGLGLTYTPAASSFMLWSPVADSARVLLYEKGEGGDPLRTLTMTRAEGGVWATTVGEDVKGLYYAFQTYIGGRWMLPVPDPYAKATGVNGKRAQVVDMSTTNPPGWENDRRPPLSDPNAIVIYELHVRDMSIHSSSGIRNKGKYLGLAETGTRNPQGLATGLDHLKELGITHVHLLPVFDFMSIDESKLHQPQFNWGYDPQNYNVPEGSYSSDPYDGAVRIREFKQLVKTLHDNGIRVVMDVVYNHTGATEESLFNQLVPGYYYRQNAEGGWSNAAACGNETASERPMMRKFMLESMRYWVEEYHIDGFRVDLMGIHDIETMNLISKELHRIEPSIFIYGEGWTAGSSPLPDSLRALKANTYRLDRIAAFSDNIRDAIKGHVFTHDDTGFATGKPGMKETLKFGVVASVMHPQVRYDSVAWLDPARAWAAQPSQTITYVSCHDNHTLWDRLLNSTADATEAERIRMHKLAGAIVLTSQGVSFLHAGVDMLRTKQGVENSFNQPDSINQLDWNRKTKYKDVFDYFRGLIALRKNHPAFRMTEAKQIQQHLRFLDHSDPLVLAYTIDAAAVGDSWKQVLVVYNGNRHVVTIDVPAASWRIVANDKTINENGISQHRGGRLTVPASSAMVLVQ